MPTAPNMKTIARAFALAFLALQTGCAEFADDEQSFSAPVSLGSEIIPLGEDSRMDVSFKGGQGGAGEFEDPLLDEPRSIQTGEGADSDYIDKADIYWKLRWLKGEVEAGRYPSNMGSEVDELEERTAGTAPDQNRPLLEDAVKGYRDGFAAHKAIDEIKAGGLDPATIPWGTGRYLIEESFKKSNLSKDPILAGLGSRPLSKAQFVALDWETQHHKSPIEVRDVSIEKATTTTDLIAEELGLADRGPNAGGDPTAARMRGGRTGMSAINKALGVPEAEPPLPPRQRP